MDKNNNMESVLDECERLGIIDIKAAGTLTPTFIKEAVEAVKDTNLDFNAIAAQMEQERAAYR